jgi:nucleotide-binding universal stress UspA family protein
MADLAISVRHAPSAAGAGRREAPPVRSGPVLIAYDGTKTSEEALREAAALLGGRPALLVVVWKPGLAFELIELPASSIGLPPAPLDVRTALETEDALYEGAQRAAQRAAALARSLGLEADALVVAEDPGVTVAETLLRIARERDARAITLGAHPHGGLLGSTTRGVVREARCPVLVVRADAE